LKIPIVAGLTLRKARPEDGPFLLAVRNEPEVRSHSKTQTAIPESTHVTWLNQQLNESGPVIWIIENKGCREGYVRAQEIRTGKWLLSVALQSRFHGKGHGSWAVREVSRLLIESYGARRLEAEVLATNAVAIRLFEAIGFAQKAVIQEGGVDMVRFELTTH